MKTKTNLSVTVYALDVIGIAMSSWTVDFGEYEFEDSSQREAVRNAVHALYCSLWDEATVILFSDECQDSAIRRDSYLPPFSFFHGA